MANAFVRHLRRNPTEEERILWSQLRRRQLMGLRFRRQVPLGPYVVDFACLEHRFIVEVDGLQHAEPAQRANDEARTAWLELQGFRVFRAWNGEIRDNLNRVLESLLGELGLLDGPMMPMPVDVAGSINGNARADACDAAPSGASRRRRDFDSTRHLPRKGGGGQEASPIDKVTRWRA